MKINSQQYAAALLEITADKTGRDLETAIAGFARFLTSRHDDFKMEKIVLAFESLWYQKFSVVKAEIKSARALSPELQKSLAEKLKVLSQAKELLLSESVSSDIIGGAVIKYGDKILDAGLGNRLQKFKEALTL